MPEVTRYKNNMEDKSAVTAVLVQTVPKDTVNSLKYGSFIIQVRVLDENGFTVNGAPVTMSISNNLAGDSIDKVIDTLETPKSTDYYTSFEYIPTTKGTKTLTFTSGELTTDLEIVVS